MAACKQLIVAVVLVGLEVRFTLSGGSKVCGQDRICKDDEYCSDNFCINCSQICHGSNSHSYDQVKCNEDCGDYLSKIQLRKEFTDYLKNLTTNLTNEVQELRAEVDHVNAVAVISLVLPVILIIFVAGAALFWYLRKRRGKILNADKTKMKIQSVHAISTVDGMRKDLHIKMPSPIIDHKDTASTDVTSTPIRYPVEDTTLEYVYDNPALTHSPTSLKEPTVLPRTETSF